MVEPLSVNHQMESMGGQSLSGQIAFWSTIGYVILTHLLVNVKQCSFLPVCDRPLQDVAWRAPGNAQVSRAHLRGHPMEYSSGRDYRWAVQGVRSRV